MTSYVVDAILKVAVAFRKIHLKKVAQQLLQLRTEVWRKPHLHNRLCLNSFTNKNLKFYYREWYSQNLYSITFLRIVKGFIQTAAYLNLFVY